MHARGARACICGMYMHVQTIAMHVWILGAPNTCTLPRQWDLWCDQQWGCMEMCKLLQTRTSLVFSPWLKWWYGAIFWVYRKSFGKLHYCCTVYTVLTIADVPSHIYSCCFTYSTFKLYLNLLCIHACNWNVIWLLVTLWATGSSARAQLERNVRYSNNLHVTFVSKCRCSIMHVPVHNLHLLFPQLMLAVLLVQISISLDILITCVGPVSKCTHCMGTVALMVLFAWW